MIESIVLAGALMAGPATAGTAAVEQAQTAASLIPRAWRPFAECVSKRESHHNYRARNRSSSASGRWQFLDLQWRVNGGIEWIVSRQLKRAGVAWSARKPIVKYLDATPIYRWPEWAQDAAFVGVVTERRTGWRHWSLPGHRCQSLVPGFAR